MYNSIFSKLNPQDFHLVVSFVIIYYLRLPLRQKNQYITRGSTAHIANPQKVGLIHAGIPLFIWKYFQPKQIDTMNDGSAAKEKRVHADI